MFNVNDCGTNGKQFECDLKKEFACKVKVAKPNQTDLIKKVDGKRTKFECKTASGELANLDKDGNIVKDITCNDYIIYRATLTSETYVMNAKDFWEMVNENDLVRFKFTTEMNNIKKSGGEWYYDRITLKTIDDKTSHRKRDLINALLDERAETLDEFIANHEIRIAQERAGEIPLIFYSHTSKFFGKSFLDVLRPNLFLDVCNLIFGRMRRLLKT